MQTIRSHQLDNYINYEVMHLLSYTGPSAGGGIAYFSLYSVYHEMCTPSRCGLFVVLLNPQWIYAIYLPIVFRVVVI